MHFRARRFIPRATNCNASIEELPFGDVRRLAQTPSAELHEQLVAARKSFVCRFDPDFPAQSITDFAEFVRDEIDYLAADLRGDFIGELMLAGDARALETERMEALRRARKAANVGVARQRRPLLKPRLHDLAAWHHRDFSRELEQHMATAILLAFEFIDTVPVRERGAILKTLRARVGNLVTEGILGPGWRRRQNGLDESYSGNHGDNATVMDGDDATAPDQAEGAAARIVQELMGDNASGRNIRMFRKIEDSIYLEQLIPHELLSPHEGQFMLCLLAADGDPDLAARWMRVSPAYGWKLKQRATSKIQAN